MNMDDSIEIVPGLTPPWWDERECNAAPGGGEWVIRFVEFATDGSEIDHLEQPRGVRSLRVGCCGYIEQTATWNDRYKNPVVPPGIGWDLYRACVGYSLWRRPLYLPWAGAA